MGLSVKEGTATLQTLSPALFSPPHMALGTATSLPSSSERLRAPWETTESDSETVLLPGMRETLE